MSERRCRFCEAPLGVLFADLGMSPLSNAFVTAEALGGVERYYPLQAWVCERCFLVQIEAFESPEAIFGDYAYFSSFADSWLEHARRFVEGATARFRLGAESRVIEVASNDGYLLQYFRDRGVSVLGIEPAANVARQAEANAIPTVVEFLGARSARAIVERHGPADLVIGNNVFAHVPDLNDFTVGLRLLLKPTGVLSLEFPHLARLVDEHQFDTIYHEHFSYFSFRTAREVLAAHGLAVFDVEELPTHGGSLRVLAAPEAARRTRTPAVDALAEREAGAGLFRIETYTRFAERVKRAKRDLLRFLIDARERGKSVAGYGAPAKGNTLLNYCGVRTDLLDYTVDRNPYKQGRYLPGSHIPVHAPEKLRETRPDYVLILPWNLRAEIVAQHDYIRDWGGRFVVPIPAVEVLA